MGAKYQALKGMDDLLPGEIEKWQWLEQKARVFFESHGFKEIRTPVLEYTELFARSVGEASDIVHKEMFSFKDRGDRDISLRPEMTASVARAVIEHGLLKTNKSLRLYYMGPMFRAERPQAGRKRQFHQIGIEMINEENSGRFNVDVHAIFLLCRFLSFVGLRDFRIRLNNLGNFEQQRETASKLKQYFTREKSKLCPDCQYRLNKNVLRIFDCKNKDCQPVIDKAPWHETSKEFGSLIDCLKSSPIPYDISRRLVRGLDYYNGTVFEAAASGLGAQDALAGGGRYDRLYSDLGGMATPCTGFSIGMERLLVALEGREPALKKIYFAPLEDPQKNHVMRELVSDNLPLLRERNIYIETLSGETSLSNHLKRANHLGIRFVLILGSSELEKGCWTVKDMEKKTQNPIRKEELIPYMEKVFQS